MALPFKTGRPDTPKKPTIAIFGLGYVGLTLGAVLAETGFKVFGVEPRKKDIKNLKRGKVSIHEKGLEDVLKRFVNKNFKVFDNPDNIRADIYIVAVGTPTDSLKKAPKLSYVRAAAKSIGRLLKRGDLIILRSTVPVGTTRNYFIPIVEKLSSLRAGTDFSVVFAPERTAEGNALSELKTLPQVIGGIDANSVDKASAFFKSFAPKAIPVSTLEAAELVKLFNNTFRDVLFGFANEVALICHGFNMDPGEIISSANEDYPRGQIPYPSPGVGGYCLTKDPYILLHSTKNAPFHPYIVFHGRKVNAMMPRHVAEKVKRFIKCVLAKPPNKITVGILGFAFKGSPETTDMRYSPTIEVARYLKKTHVNIVGHDPVVDKRKILCLGVRPVHNVADVFTNTDCVILMTNHAAYRRPEMLKYLRHMKKPALFFDPWQLHPKDKILRESGMHYSNLGFDSF